MPQASAVWATNVGSFEEWSSASSGCVSLRAGAPVYSEGRCAAEVAGVSLRSLLYEFEKSELRGLTCIVGS